MIKYLFLYFILALISAIAIDFSTALMVTFVYVFGIVLLFIANIKNNKNINSIINVYQIVYFFGFIYMIMCYLYMTSYGYEYLIAWDVHNYFIPVLEQFLTQGDIGKAFNDNWSEFNFFSRYQSGYFGYLIPFAYLSNYLDSNFYVSMQLSSLLVGSLSSVVIFKLLLVNQLENKKAYKYAVIISLFSVVFFYSTLLLRDIVVMFFYLLGIYLTFRKDFSLGTLLKILIVIIASCTLRIETGLFLFLLVPVYLLLTIQQSRKKTAAILAGFVIGLAGLLIFAANFDQVSSVLSQNEEFYLESDKGSGVIGNLQKIPIAGPILSILYNAIQPLPFWLKYTPDSDNFRPEAYNIMTFPLSFASLFNWIALFFIIIFLINKNIRRKVSKFISKPLLYQLVLGFIFLYIQSAVISQRRLMAYYVIFYILFYIIYTHITVRDKGKLMLGALFSYFTLQVFALFYKI